MTTYAEMHGAHVRTRTGRTQDFYRALQDTIKSRTAAGYTFGIFYLEHIYSSEDKLIKETDVITVEIVKLNFSTYQNTGKRTRVLFKTKR